MSIQEAKSATQLQGYLTQVLKFRDKEVGRITKIAISKILDVSTSTLRNFNKAPTKKKLFKNFVKKFPNEATSWPNNSGTIGKVLSKADILFFLGRTTPPTLTTHSLALAPIVISYRGHQSKKDGLGALFDHMTLQRSTQRSTVALYHQDQQVSRPAQARFREALRQHSALLPYGAGHAAVTSSNQGGLFVIPGRVRKLADEPCRLAHEKQAIKIARLTGQPMLGICAGSWRIWQHMGGSLIQVTDHSYGGGMLRLSKKDGKTVGYNKQVHNIRIEAHSLLELSMKKGAQELPERISVNSVHWKAVDPNSTPSSLQIGAWSERIPGLVIGKRQKNQFYQPQEATPEAFESKFGAPILGIQWHPEGYNHGDSKWDSSPHIRLLTYMAKAGDAFAAKRVMLQEFNQRPVRSSTESG